MRDVVVSKITAISKLVAAISQNGAREIRLRKSHTIFDDLEMAHMYKIVTFLIIYHYHHYYSRYINFC